MTIWSTKRSGLEVVVNSEHDCPPIYLVDNLDLQITVLVNGKDCNSHQFTARPSSAVTKPDGNCAPINIFDSSELRVQVTLRQGAPKYEGVELRNKSGDQVSLTYDLKGCGFPDINMNGLIDCYLWLRSG